MHANLLAIVFLSISADPTLIHVTDGTGSGVTDAIVELCPDAQFQRKVVKAAHTKDGIYKITAAELIDFDRSIHFRASLENGPSKEGRPVVKVNGADWPPAKLAVTLLRDPITFRPPGIAPIGRVYVLDHVDVRLDAANSRHVHTPYWRLDPIPLTVVNSLPPTSYWDGHAAPVTTYYAPVQEHANCTCRPAIYPAN